MIFIITACTALKDDLSSIEEGSKTICPHDYIPNSSVLQKLLQTRIKVFQLPNIDLGVKETYGFDLYTKTGFAYRHLRNYGLNRIRAVLSSRTDIQWYFLSGGYGILNALEPVKNYQATFNRTIHYQRQIPYTASIWKTVLPDICEEILKNHKLDFLYVFGSQDYTTYIKSTYYWDDSSKIRMFESTGSAGVHWLSPKILELVNAMLNEELNEFNAKYQKFIKQ